MENKIVWRTFMVMILKTQITLIEMPQIHLVRMTIIASKGKQEY